MSNEKNGAMPATGGESSTSPISDPPAAGWNIKKLIRQNSEKVGMYAENVVLPYSKRSIKRPLHEVIPLDVESQHQVGPVQAVSQPIKQEKQFPYFMVGISFIQVLLFYYGDDIHDDLWLSMAYDPKRRHEIWRYLTIMLTHSSASHLWGNVLFQLILGVFLEIVHHWKRVALIYIASVIGGTLAITLLDPSNYGVGASGGVYGLLFAHVSTFILNWNEMGCKCCRLFFLLAYIAFDLGINFYVELHLKTKTNTSHAGHLGGALTGFLVACLVLKNFEKHPWEKKYQKICAGILVALAVLIVLVNISFPSYYRESEFNFNYEESYLRTIFKAIDDSEEGSEIKKLCDNHPECKEAYEIYKNQTSTG